MKYVFTKLVAVSGCLGVARARSEPLSVIGCSSFGVRASDWPVWGTFLLIGCFA